MSAIGYQIQTSIGKNIHINKFLVEYWSVYIMT